MSLIEVYFFLEVRFLEVRFFDDRFLPDFLPDFLLDFFPPFLELFFDGTLAPSLRASDRPIAIACFLLVTFLPERPLFRVPSFITCMARSTFLPAFLPYFAISPSLPWTVVSTPQQL